MIIDRLRRTFSDPEICWLIGRSQKSLSVWLKCRRIPDHYEDRLLRLRQLWVKAPQFDHRNDLIKWLHTELRKEETPRTRIPARGILRRKL